MNALDEAGFEALVAPYRSELQAHCYRVLGSLEDAEEAIQDTLLSAWQHYPDFEHRSSVRTWLYRIATNRCLDQLRAGRRRPMATPLSREPPEPSSSSEVAWLQPYPDDLLVEDPADAVAGRETIGLAYVRALQLLPPRQRVVLVLRDVLAFRAAEVAEMLEITEEAVTSALKRARATLRVEEAPEPPPPPRSAQERTVVQAWLDAFCLMDIPRLVELLTEDAWLRMPPLPFEYHGRAAAARFFTAMQTGARHDRILQTRANGQPAYSAYAQDRVTGLWHSRGLFVITVAGDKVHEVTRFEPALAAHFGLPRTLPE
ncbi:sigma-70 family RNA polymerase sigma factor [Microlunatus elymi]|uniref:Sigma-70 family RNA polymerase sigma factor n=1 Tax=Microlunatus elymi TaxID=2596828 RepID=A0A516PWT1_9ACTN|nr:RNA polymerase subunit sigma-70 [Microlunatus elymi]QDP95643.1 sigma-70 family RNA polymerase sigma factor [Microlunatus elymi]